MAIEEIRTLLSLLLALAVMLSYASYRSAQRVKSRFNLFAVRDDLVLLVADDHLAQDSPVFEYFYQRINRILSDDNPMGYHDLLLAVTFMQDGNTNLRKAIAESFRQSQKILALPQAKTPQVREVINAYYKAVAKLLLAHSNFLKFAYLASRIITLSMAKRVLRMLVSKDIDAGLVIITQSKKTAHQLAAV